MKNLRSFSPYQLLLVTLLFIWTITVSAQERGQMRRQFPDSLARNMPKIGKVYGKILDKKTNKPVSYASVAVISARDSAIVGGALSDAKGKFLVEELPFGKFRLRITFLGYGTFFTDLFTINPSNQESDAGTVFLSSSAANLKEVNVTAENPDLINSLDRRVYNVDKNIVNTGGTVTEVLSNIPSVSVDMDGKVSLRGTENVTILIDGKPSGMLGGDRKAVLQQIPASAVEQIEVITNPSAKYDAEGMGGIINIKTKKERMKGMNGNVAAGIGTNNKYNLSAGVNNRTSKVNIFANYSYRHENRSSSGEGVQNYFFPGQAPYSYSYTSHGNGKSDFHSGKLGADFYLNRTNTLSLSGTLSQRNGLQPGASEYSFLNDTGYVYQHYFTTNSEDEKNRSYDCSLDYRRTWSHSKRELSAVFSFNSNDRNERGGLTSSLYSDPFLAYQWSDNKGLYSSFISQVDLVQPVKTTGKFEAGLKNTQRKLDNDQVVSLLDASGLDYTIDPQKSDHFIYHEQVLGAYSMYTGKWKKFDYNAGLRFEQTLSDGESKTQSSAFTTDYFSFFPSAFLKYEVNNIHEVQLSYSRRVNRPESRSLNPFVDYSDSLSQRKGNPRLQPEYIQSLELAYSRSKNNLSLTTTLYYRHTDNLISRFREVNGSTGVSTTTFINYSSSENLGGEAVVRYSKDKLGNVMWSFNLYRNTINGQNVQAELQSAATQWSTRMNLNFKIGPATNFQVTGSYSSPMESPVAKFKGMSSVDAGVRQDLWKGKGTLSLNVTDIFLTRKMDIQSYNDFYNSHSIRRRESRVAMLSFSYRFGNQDSNLFQRKKNQKNNVPQQENPEMIDF